MKAKIHIPTMEYGFIEIEADFEPGSSVDDVITLHDNVKMCVLGKDGLNTREWARVRNDFILKNEIDEEDYNKLSKAQRYVINEVKIAVRSIKE